MTKSKTIFRTMKDKDNPFVMIDRRPIENPDLSWKAKGILAYLLSRPDNWTVQIGDLVKRSTDKAFAIRGAINELVRAGHIYRREERDPATGRFVRYVLEVYELPFTGSPLIGFPQAGFPHTGNLPLNDTDVNETELKDAATPLSSEDLSDIKERANKTVDAILENDRKVQEMEIVGHAWRGRELVAPDYLPYGDWWHSKTNQHMYGEKGKAKVNTEWLKAFKAWWENDVTVAVLEQVYDAEKSWKGVIAKPSELTTKAIALQVLPPEKETKKLSVLEQALYDLEQEQLKHA